MEITLRYLVVLFFFVSFSHTSEGLSGRSSEGVSFINFKQDEYSYLNITSIGSDLVEDSSECGFACLEIPSCFSYNLAAVPDINKKKLCELLPSDKYNNTDKVIASLVFHHFSIPSPCSRWPCQNNGTCVSQYEKNSYVCLCTKEFSGKHCQTNYDECTRSPCLNGGTCVNGKRNFSCICHRTHKGRTCEEFDECSSNPCLNNGTCTDGVDNYTCSCPSPFFGNQCQETDECKSSPCLNGGTCVDGVYDFTCVCQSRFIGKRCEGVAGISCKNLLNSGNTASGSYSLKINGKSFQVYCDMSANAGGWTLIARFSNADTKNWMRDDAYWWYDIQSPQGSPTSTSSNYDMISEAFWRVEGSDIKITRSDDSSHTALLRTYTNCLGGNTLRGFSSSYGNFSYRNVWSINQCLGSCPVYYGGSYNSTASFNQAHCSGNMQGSDRIGFWCHWDSGDGSVMMFGGGGSSCGRADHGIGITENNEGGFEEWSQSGEEDFGYNALSSVATSYSLNLWIR